MVGKMIRKPLSKGLRKHYDILAQYGWIICGEDFMCDGKYCSECPLNGTRCIGGVIP